MEGHLEHGQRSSHENVGTESYQSTDHCRDSRTSLDAGKYILNKNTNTKHRRLPSTFVCPANCIIAAVVSSRPAQDRDKLQRQHLNDTVEELKRFNARRKLKGAVLSVAGGVALDPLYGAETDSSE